MSRISFLIPASVFFSHQSSSSPNSGEGEAMEERASSPNSGEGEAMEERAPSPNSGEGEAMEERAPSPNSGEGFSCQRLLAFCIARGKDKACEKQPTQKTHIVEGFCAKDYSHFA